MRQVVLLRGVNVGGRNKLAMPALRAALEQAGMKDVTTYVQSGNVVLDSAAKPDALARACEAVIAERFVCFEPMTAPTNALRSGHSLPHAAAGELFSAAFAIVASFGA